MSEPTHCEHGLPFSGDCAECDQPFDRLASVMDEEPSPTPTGESEGERIQCPAGRALNPNVAWRIVGNDVKRPVHLDGSTCECWRLFPNGEEPSPEEPARASTSMTKRPNVHDFTDQQDYAEALEKWGQSHAGDGRCSAVENVYFDVDENVLRHSDDDSVCTHPPARASREGDALLTRIEEAIGLASQLGDEAFDYIEGRGLLQERLAIREAIRAIASRLHAAERRSEELERENVEAWEMCEAHGEKIRSLQHADHTCGCSYDRPGDVCMHHSPQLSKAIERAETAERALASVIEAWDKWEGFGSTIPDVRKVIDAARSMPNASLSPVTDPEGTAIRDEPHDCE